jgi:hypothetical protein
VAAAQVLRARLTGRLPDLTPGVVATFRHEWAYSSDRAVREIGYAVTPLGEGLRRTLAALAPAASRVRAAGDASGPQGMPRT